MSDTARISFSPFLLGVALIASLFASTSRLQGAEIICLTEVAPQAASAWQVDSDGEAKARWPSGYRPKAGACGIALLRGPIERGDADKFTDFFRRNHKILMSLKLQSPGGDVSEALKIGMLVRKYLIGVTAPGRLFWMYNVCEGADCVCASACALIWFGSVDRSGTVGLHRPLASSPGFSSPSFEQASEAYKRVLRDVSAYLERMEVPRSVIERFLATGSTDIDWLDDEGLQHPPSFAEFLSRSCEVLNSAERSALSRLRSAEAGQSMTDSDTMLFKQLREKEYRLAGCLRDLLYRQRDALAAP